MTELFMTIRKALSSIEMDRKMGELPVKPSPEYKAGDIVGSGREMREIFRWSGSFAKPNDGSDRRRERYGKGTDCQSYPNYTSPNEPFIAVNCSAIVETLLESELFGHEKGSFTSAFNRQLGKFELARYGTLFWMKSARCQSIFRLNSFAFFRKWSLNGWGQGQNPGPFPSLSSNEQGSSKTGPGGKIPGDLFYRLNIVSIRIPPLRERQDDIPGWSIICLSRSTKIFTDRSLEYQKMYWGRFGSITGPAMCVNWKIYW